MSVEQQKYHPELDGFETIYEIELKPRLKNHEWERRFRLFVGLILAAIMVPIGYIVARYLYVTSSDPDSDVYHLVWLLPMGAYMGMMYGLRARTKDLLMKKIAGFLGWEHHLDRNADAIVNRLESHGLLPQHSHIRVSDSLRGQHMNWPFEVCEIKLVKTRYNGRRTVEDTVFKGLILTFLMDPPSPFVTSIARHYPGGEAPRRLRYAQTYEDEKGMISVTSNGQDALDTVLCARFQTALTELDLSLPEVDISCLLHRHELHIPISAPDRFELDWMFDAMDSPERIDKLLNEFSEILRMLDIVLKRRACPHTGETDYPDFRRSEPIS